MKNQYLIIEDYKKFTDLFELSEEDIQKRMDVIEAVKKIMLLKRETPQKSSMLYLKPIMFPDDYKKINKVLKDQLEFKLGRELKKIRDNLVEKGTYADEDIKEKLKKEEIKLRKELGLPSKSKKDKKIIKVNALTLEDIKHLKEEEDE